MPKGDRSRDVLSEAQRKYNWLLNIPTIVNPKENTGYAEVWQPGDYGAPGDLDNQRSPDLPIDKGGIEILNDEEITPDMLAGEAVSHIMNNPEDPNYDPRVAEHYERFKESLTPEQDERLTKRYIRATQREDHPERRTEEQWREMTGIPGEFRAYPFRQWDHEGVDYTKAFTDEQRVDLDNMMDYLRTRKK